MRTKFHLIAVAACLASLFFAIPVVAGESSNRNSGMSESEARQIALAKVPGGQIERSKIDRKRDGRVIYEYDISGDDGWYDIEIDGDTGEMVKYEKEGGRRRSERDRGANARTASGISMEDAKEIALQRAGGGEVVKIKTKNKWNGRVIYDVEVVSDRYEHEVEIDGETGDILDYERDYID